MPNLAPQERNLFSGVSQQPHTQRSPSHLNAQLNAIVSQGRLLGKRPGSQHVARLSTTTSGDPFTFLVTRSATEKYLAVIVNGTLAIYDWFTGDAITVDAPEGYGYLQSAPEGFREVTVGDRTVLVNRSVTVQKGTAVSPAGGEETLVVVRQGNFGTRYSITVDSTTVTFLTNKSTATDAEDYIGTDFIATELYDLLVASGPLSGDFTFTRTGSTIRIAPAVVGQVYTVTTADGLGDEGMAVLKGSVQRFSDLPPQAPDGTLLEVRGDESTAFDNFWVIYDTATSVWKETIAPRCLTGFTASTLPHLVEYRGAYLSSTAHEGVPSVSTFTNSALDLAVNSLIGKRIRNLTDNSEGTVTSNTADTIIATPLAGGGRNNFRAGDLVEVVGYGRYFLFHPAPWADRETGDTVTNPYPSLVGQKIRDAFVTQGRLGFITPRSIVLSSVAKPFHLFRSTVVQIVSSDPIDITETLPSSSQFHAVTEWDKRIIVWTDLAQYELVGDPILSATTVSLPRRAQYQNSAVCRPVASGSRIFFVGFVSGFTKVMELAIFGQEQRFAAQSLTEEIPTFIQGTPTAMEADDTAGVLLLSSRVGTDTHLYILTYVTENAQRVQQAWGRWCLGGAQPTPVLTATITDTDPLLD